MGIQAGQSIDHRAGGVVDRPEHAARHLDAGGRRHGVSGRSGQRLPAGSRLVLELHYRKSATPQTDQSGVAFHFGGRPRRELRHRSLSCGASSIDRDIEALAVTPRASGAGASIEIAARRADGSIEALCGRVEIRAGVPVTYRFRTGVRLRSGTVIDVRSSSPGCAAELDFVARQ